LKKPRPLKAGASIWPVLKASPSPDTPIHHPGGKNINLRPATETERNERHHGHGGEAIATVRPKSGILSTIAVVDVIAKINRGKLPFEHAAVRRRTG
jgi:hypothetical protein